MPDTTISKYCCQYVDFAFEYFSPLIDCSNTYTVNITSVTAGSGAFFYSPWTDSRALERSCASVDACDNGSSLYIRYYVGCLPRSNFDLVLHYQIIENGSVIDTGTEETSGGYHDCTAGLCPEICT